MKTKNNENTSYSAELKRGRFFIVLFFIVFVLVFIFSFCIGKYKIPADELFHIFFGKLTGAKQTWTDAQELVVFKIRMPRILAGALIGAGLSAAGAAYQGLFRNPMVSPDVLGASAGAGFGAAVSFLFGMSYSFVSIAAFICGTVAVGVACLISSKAKRNPTLGMVLAGIMISSLFNSATSYVKLISDPNDVLPAITFWLMGSISNIRQESLILAAIPILLGMGVLLILRWRLNMLTMGEDEARSMGVNTKVTRIITVCAATLITASCVCISGMIGWVGLAIPHFARLAAGYNYRVMLPVAMLMGAAFLMLVDIFSRTVSTAEIPLGILTSFVGAPFFIYLILDRGNKI